MKLDANPKINELFYTSFSDAAVSLSLLVNKNMSIRQSRIELKTPEDLINQVDERMDQMYIGSVLKLSKDLKTSIVFTISEEAGLKLYDSLAGNEIDTNATVNQEVISGIGEVNNIIGSAFINNLARIMKTEVSPTVPVNKYDLLGAILQGVMLQKEFLKAV